MQQARWICARCSEEHSIKFMVCWKCGTTIHGQEDPHFTPIEDEYDAPYTPEVRRINLRSIFAFIIAVMIAILLLQYGRPVISSFTGVLIASMLYAMTSESDMRKRMAAAYFCFLLLLLPVLLLILLVDTVI